MLQMLDHTIAATRRIAADLRPLLLDDLGLVPAIEWLTHSFNQRTGVACTLAADEALELREPYATAIFRIVQESLANVAKHAGASAVTIALERIPGAITLAVSDNGCGFTVGAISPVRPPACRAPRPTCPWVPRDPFGLKRARGKPAPAKISPANVAALPLASIASLVAGTAMRFFLCVTSLTRNPP